MNFGKIADNMQSLAAVINRFDTTIEPLVKRNSDMIAANKMMVDMNSGTIGANSANIAAANSGISTASIDIASLQIAAASLPSQSSSTITWKDQIQNMSFVGFAVAAPTANQMAAREDYIDSIDVIFPMHKEYMPIIEEFICYEDAMGGITGFEVDYHIKPVLETMFQPSRAWKRVGRSGSNAQTTSKTLNSSETNYISKVTATVGETIEQLKLETINGDEVVCGKSNPVGTEMVAEGYIVAFDTHWRENLVGLDTKFTSTAVGDTTNMTSAPFR